MRVTGERNKDYEPKKQLLNRDQERDLETFLLAPHGREIALDGTLRKNLAEHQISPPSKSYPTCFAKAVIGLQSRCTRPFCENLIGGSDLTESLRTKVLDELGPSMTRYQQTDPDIVHPRPATVSVDQKAVVKGETTPRSKINVALLGRYGNTSIPNMQSLENALLEKGFSVQTIHLDYPTEVGHAQAAQLFQKQNILVAPQGDGLGYADWMEPGSVVVSILPRFTRSSKIYTDRMMAFGKRLFAWDCQDETCVQANRDLAHECIEAVEDSSTYSTEMISAVDFEDFANMKKDFQSISVTWKAITDCYTKEVSRRIHSDELALLIEGLAKDFTFSESEPLDAHHVKRGGNGYDDVDDDGDEGEEDGVDTEEGEEDVTAFEEGVDGFVEEKTTDLEPSDIETIEDDEGESMQDENVDPSEPEDLDKDGVVRIEGAKDDEGQEEKGTEDDDSTEDINVHEYDETKPEDGTIEDKETTTPATTSTAYVPVVPVNSKETTAPNNKDADNTHVTSPTQDQPPRRKNSDHAQPLLDFAEFCTRGLCCGAAKSAQPVGATGAKGLTPCATSMTTIVFGPKGVWGQVDETMTIQESQSLVWQVDLSRPLAP